MITELTIPNRDATISNCTQPDKDACVVLLLLLQLWFSLLSAVNYALFLTEFLGVYMYFGLNAALPVCAATLHWLNQSSINYFLVVLF